MDIFDYIIIGEGSAGCVPDNRLSEDPDKMIREKGADMVPGK